MEPGTGSVGKEIWEVKFLVDDGPDRNSLVLGTGFRRFHGRGQMRGLYMTKGRRIDFLVVHCDEPGRGHFREFVQKLKRGYDTICVWCVWNPWLGAVLERYGFRDEVDSAMDGTPVTGKRWDKTKT